MFLVLVCIFIVSIFWVNELLFFHYIVKTSSLCKEPFSLSLSLSQYIMRKGVFKHLKVKGCLYFYGVVYFLRRKFETRKKGKQVGKSVKKPGVGAWFLRAADLT